MRLWFLVCADSAAVDIRTNSLSVFHLVEDINVPAFPFALARIVVAGLFSRATGEPETFDGLEMLVDMSGKELYRGPLALNFQGRMRSRMIAELQGMVLEGPGELRFTIVRGAEELGRWTVLVNHVGQPNLQTELPLN